MIIYIPPHPLTIDLQIQAPLIFQNYFQINPIERVMFIIHLMNLKTIIYNLFL